MDKPIGSVYYVDYDENIIEVKYYEISPKGRYKMKGQYNNSTGWRKLNSWYTTCYYKTLSELIKSKKRKIESMQDKIISIQKIIEKAKNKKVKQEE